MRPAWHNASSAAAWRFRHLPRNLAKFNHSSVKKFAVEHGWTSREIHTTPAQQKGEKEASRITVLLCFESWWHSCSKCLVINNLTLCRRCTKPLWKGKQRNRESHSSERRIHLAPVLSRFRCFMFHPPNIWSHPKSFEILDDQPEIPLEYPATPNDVGFFVAITPEAEALHNSSAPQPWDLLECSGPQSESDSSWEKKSGKSLRDVPRPWNLVFFFRGKGSKR